MKTYKQQIAEIQSSICVSKLLKDTISKFDDRDVLDALRDAETLARLLRLKLDEIQH
jgi:hypothetical protein